MDIEKLAKKLKKAQDAYYNKSPILTDSEYDRLYLTLKEWDPNHPVLKNVGAPPSNHLKKVKHTIPMGSLNNVFTTEEFLSWARKTKAEFFVIQEKLDGISVELEYKNGCLLQASTRGDGRVGEDITFNVRKMKNVVHRFKKPFTGTLRGEIICRNYEFNEYLAENYANPRNAASGIARRKDGWYSEHLTILYFDVFSEVVQLVKESQKLYFIEDTLNLSTVPSKIVRIDNAVEWYNWYLDTGRAGLNYMIDGLVIKVNRLSIQESLGTVNNRPKGQIAWKFPAAVKTTDVTEVRWEVGRTGRITPVAHLEPIEVGGVTISKATLHNVSNAINLGVVEKCTVIVSRAGDVIPQIDRVVTKVDDYVLDIPLHCPVCGAKTKFEGEFLICHNNACPARHKGDIDKWIEITQIDLAGKSFIEDVYRSQLVKDPSDLYTLTVHDLLKIPGYKKTKASKILKNIQDKKILRLEVFMAGLNIPNASLSTFQELVENGFDTLEKIRKATVKKLSRVHSIGEITAESIAVGIENKDAIIDKLLKNGVIIEECKQGELSGMSFCFTGSLSEMKRGDAQNLVKEKGGIVKSGVSKGLTYLVQAFPDSQSSKSQKAKKYGTKIINEHEFYKIVGLL